MTRYKPSRIKDRHDCSHYEKCLDKAARKDAEFVCKKVSCFEETPMWAKIMSVGGGVCTSAAGDYVIDEQRAGYSEGEDEELDIINYTGVEVLGHIVIKEERPGLSRRFLVRCPEGHNRVVSLRAVTGWLSGRKPACKKCKEATHDKH